MPEANANPERRFFIDLLIRDITLEDAILDLIDNSIDALVRTREIDLYKDYINLSSREQNAPANIHIIITPKQFTIEDNCGGIPYESALNDIFRFGHPDPHRGPSLSVFGIGMKRALFKIGHNIEITSLASDDGFHMNLDVEAWSNPIEPTTDWKIPIEKLDSNSNGIQFGTKIKISKLRKEISEIVENPTFQNRLISAIKESYPFYLGKDVRIYVNKNEVTVADLSIGESHQIKPTIEQWQDGNVKAALICGLLPKDDESWTYEKSGWYILCNGRVVVNADKSKLTGWGSQLPIFMPKNRGLLGIIFLQSDHPEELPWKTTKRGINAESPVFIRSLKRMILATRLVIHFQNKIYESTAEDSPKVEFKDSVNDLKTVSATQQIAQRNVYEDMSVQTFEPPQLINRDNFTSIQFKVDIDDLKRVKKSLGRTSMSNKEVGEKVFNYYLDRECPK